MDRAIPFYDENAETYAGRSRTLAVDRIEVFAGRVMAGGAVLELGCGAGEDSEWLTARGFVVTPTDGSSGMAAEAEKRLGRPVRVMRFDELAEVNVYDGVWASACLLHVPRADLSDVLARIRRALRPGGIFYASYKAGDAEGSDRFGRYYNRPSSDWLSATYRAAGWQELSIEHAKGGGYDGEPTEWLHVTATA
ncbi:class I SAM-dependent methyltransferase [Rhizobium sp. S153]|uniref:Class I SAM-dependent methyltransferase n=1 Tax=Ciceribacter sichuanensis TaxID=2949647 RepID=A0ABT0V601_9HYPH|nr:class I SAM-dependent methyltransferase [Ciceribacter sp. S153]MCM2401282.1 class I SAM-dependent methyltransferase [Ciceribacter sp. S153]